MATAEEILARTVTPETEPHIVIGPDRVIIVPPELQNIAVQYDHNIETVIFDCPRYWDDHDMSTMRVFIEYTRADTARGSYECMDVSVDVDNDGIMHFSWTLDSHATASAGKLLIQVVVKSSDEDGNLSERWGSIINDEMQVKPSMNALADFAQQYPDTILGIMTRLDAIVANGATLACINLDRYSMSIPVGGTVTGNVSDLTRVPVVGEVFTTVCDSRYYTVFRVVDVQKRAVYTAQAVTRVDLLSKVQAAVVDNTV
jgi:hypothetical protein